MNTIKHEDLARRAHRNHEHDRLAVEGALESALASLPPQSDPQAGDIPEGPETLRTASQYLRDAAIVYGFAATSGAPAVLEMEILTGENGVTLTRGQWDALKASIDASWPEHIEVDALS
jgi:hypothetical protein